MVILGVMGSVWGSFIGASLLTLITEIVQAAEKFNIIAYGIILTMVLIFLPEGVLIYLRNFYQKYRGQYLVGSK